MDDIRSDIAILKAKHGLSQAQIARFLGVPPKTLGDWLHGRTRCRHVTLLKLALEGLRLRLDTAGMRRRYAEAMERAETDGGN